MGSINNPKGVSDHRGVNACGCACMYLCECACVLVRVLGFACVGLCTVKTYNHVGTKGVGP